MEYMYFLSLINDYSRKVWVNLLKTKNEAAVLETFKSWKALVENQTNKRLKVLRTNNGLEFFNESFLEFLQKQRCSEA